MNLKEVIRIIDELSKSFCKGKTCNACPMGKDGFSCQALTAMRYLEELEE